MVCSRLSLTLYRFAFMLINQQWEPLLLYLRKKKIMHFQNYELPCKGTSKVFTLSSHRASIAIRLTFATENLKVEKGETICQFTV
jgi:hypothetical protein